MAEVPNANADDIIGMKSGIGDDNLPLCSNFGHLKCMLCSQVLVVLGNPELEFSAGSIFSRFFSLGGQFAWKVVGVFFLWAYLSLKIPSKVFHGPAAPHGYVPIYSANGTQFYLFTLAVFFVYVFAVDPTVCINIFDSFGDIMAVLNVTALV